MTFATRPALDSLPFEQRLEELLTMVKDVSRGRDRTIQALQGVVKTEGARIVVVGGLAVIRHGYERTTVDHDFLVDYRDVARLADRLMEDADWERLEIRQYAFIYRPTNVHVDFLVSRDLMQMGLPYYFPDLDKLETSGEVSGIPVIGLHDLLWLKLVAGRMQNLADVMQLCKLHLGKIDPQRVLKHVQPEDAHLRERFMDILRRAPQELESERRLGQGIGAQKEAQKRKRKRKKDGDGSS
jgi:hypothetical protein